MERLTTTPFGRRPLAAGHIAALAMATAPPALPRIDKWEIFNQLRTARATFGVKDRSLNVLYALLSFLPDRTLVADAALIVFPSNRALSDRAHGMPESTLRRHLAILVDANLIARHDSPTGKRYAARNRSGDLVHAFGFDLRPLLLRASDIAQAAQATEDAAREVRTLRDRLSLVRRDALKLAAYARDAGLPGDWQILLNRLTETQRETRRRMSSDRLRALTAEVARMRDDILAELHANTTNSSAEDARIERPHHNSNKEQSETINDGAVKEWLPLHLVLKACPEALGMGTGSIRDWTDLERLGERLYRLLGISMAAWEDAKRTMPHCGAAISVCCMLQRFADIRNPGGYLRALTAKAAAGRFSVVPMVLALLADPMRKVDSCQLSAAGPKS